MAIEHDVVSDGSGIEYRVAGISGVGVIELHHNSVLNAIVEP
jgi:hypothetical protein